MSTDPDHQLSVAPKPNHTHYYSDGNITFLLEGELFRIHRHFLIRDSNVFRDMLALPSPTNTEEEGLSDDRPIHLEGIKSLDFARFLSMFYTPVYVDHSHSIDEWQSILKLADMWKFDAIRKFVIKKLTAMRLDPVQKLELQRKFDIESTWASNSINDLCKRQAPLSLDETLRVGVEVAVRIAHAREDHFKKLLKMSQICTGHCNVCRQIIRGNRFKCRTCPDYDMCDDCYQDERQSHPVSHKFYSAGVR